MPIPGSLVPCRGKRCRDLCAPGPPVPGYPDAIPARRITGNPSSRGFYCVPCAERLGVPTGRAPGPHGHGHTTVTEASAECICVCGWSSRKWPSLKTATNALREHVSHPTAQPQAPTAPEE